MEFSALRNDEVQSLENIIQSVFEGYEGIISMASSNPSILMITMNQAATHTAIARALVLAQQQMALP